jgi:hypothetical protein
MLEKAGLFNQNLEVTVKNHKLWANEKDELTDVYQNFSGARIYFA